MLFFRKQTTGTTTNMDCRLTLLQLSNKVGVHTEKLESAPAPLSTLTERPLLTRSATHPGVSATLLSFSAVSLGTPAEYPAAFTPMDSVAHC